MSIREFPSVYDIPPSGGYKPASRAEQEAIEKGPSNFYIIFKTQGQKEAALAKWQERAPGGWPVLDLVKAPQADDKNESGLKFECPQFYPKLEQDFRAFFGEDNIEKIDSIRIEIPHNPHHEWAEGEVLDSEEDFYKAA